MTNHQLILDRLTAWVEKQSSVGPAAFKSMRREIEDEVNRETRRGTERFRPQQRQLLADLVERLVELERVTPQEMADDLSRELAKLRDKHGVELDVEREAKARRDIKPESIDTWRKFDDATPTEARSLVTWGYGELTAFTWAGYGWEDCLGIEVKPGGWSDKRQDNPDLLEYWRYIDTPESIPAHKEHERAASIGTEMVDATAQLKDMFPKPEDMKPLSVEEREMLNRMKASAPMGPEPAKPKKRAAKPKARKE